MDNIILGTILGSATTFSGLLVNNVFQYKKFKTNLIHKEKLIDKQNSFEVEKQYLNRKIDEIKEAHMLLSKIENEFNTTSSIIDYNSGINVVEYNNKYKDDITKLGLLKYYLDFYFPELHERVEYLHGYLNQYWDYNHSLLTKTKIADNLDFTTLVGDIRDIELLILQQIQTIKMSILANQSTR